MSTDGNAVRKVVILGAAGRDFHNFNVVFRNDPRHRVLAFTATQIPDIDGRTYPPELAGELYPDGIPIVEEDELTDLIGREQADVAVFAYSDVPHEQVMHLGSRCIASGADFWLQSARSTMSSTFVTANVAIAAAAVWSIVCYLEGGHTRAIAGR